MDIYLVGGAVRDELLGRPVRERDWVVVGSTPEEMQRLGYRQVGRDFPVFLHPDTAEEHALARTERKSGPGHTGFVCHAGPEVTLEDDLLRRDLTVNAIARATDGHVVDPFGGRADLDARVLRHVSDAFVEDPLRVFRVARFAAQLPGFEVAPETLEMMARMSARGALAELSAERVWQELEKALASDAPERFFAVLAQAGCLVPWLEELSEPTPVLPAGLDSALTRFAALAWPMTRSAVTALCRRLKSPKRFQQLAEHVASHGRTLARWRTSAAADVLDAVSAIGGLSPQRDPEPALAVVQACSGQSLDDLRGVVERVSAVGSDRFQGSGLTGQALGEAIRDARLSVIRQAQEDG